MKKLLTLVMTLMLVLTATLGLTACGKKLAMGKEMIKCDTQLDAVVKLANDDVDAIVIDSIMAGYYQTTGDYAGQIKIVDNLVLAQEEYGIAGRKEDKAFVSKINEALIALNATNAITPIAQLFGVEGSLSINDQTTNPLADATDGSWDEIKTSGKIIIGYTVFAPIAYEKAGALTGFDIELARAVVAYLNIKYALNLEVEFIVIDWNSKESLLENGSIDLVWNGMTITEDRLANMCISVPYLYNKQVAVVKTADVANYTDVASFAEAVIGVEKGSAGQSCVEGK